MMNVLISLHPGYGLGDAVQMSSVLQHVAKYRPDWKVDFRAELGRQCVGNGIVANTFCFGEQHPMDHYDAEVEILLYDTWANWHDRPNTRVSSCLHERFGLEWDKECGRYYVEVSDKARQIVDRVWTSFIPSLAARQLPVVGVHYSGDSSPANKDLSVEQVSIVCDHILDLGCIPLLFDWRNVSPLRRRHATTGGEYFSGEWGRDAEMNCAVIRKCATFVGIDSGPGKCASSTDVPTLIVWTGHHPAPFHDPAPNTTHLVPEGYHGLAPVCNDTGVIKWFEKHHTVWEYGSLSTSPVRAIKAWLTEVLG